MGNDTQSSERELVQAIVRGDETAAAKFHSMYADLVFRICCRVLMNETAAKDCAQETWIKIFRNIHQFREGGSMKSWISTIAVRTAIDAGRSIHRRTSSLAAGDDVDRYPLLNDSPRSELINQETIDAILFQLEKVSAIQRAAFVMRHMEGESLQTIATALGCSEGTVKTHIHRAVMALRKALRDYFKTEKENHEEANPSHR